MFQNFFLFLILKFVCKIRRHFSTVRVIVSGVFFAQSELRRPAAERLPRAGLRSVAARAKAQTAARDTREKTSPATAFASAATATVSAAAVHGLLLELVLRRTGRDRSQEDAAANTPLADQTVAVDAADQPPDGVAEGQRRAAVELVGPKGRRGRLRAVRRPDAGSRSVRRRVRRRPHGGPRSVRRRVRRRRGRRQRRGRRRRRVLQRRRRRPATGAVRAAVSRARAVGRPERRRVPRRHGRGLQERRPRGVQPEGHVHQVLPQYGETLGEPPRFFPTAHRLGGVARGTQRGDNISPARAV